MSSLLSIISLIFIFCISYITYNYLLYSTSDVEESNYQPDDNLADALKKYSLLDKKTMRDKTNIILLIFSSIIGILSIYYYRLALVRVISIVVLISALFCLLYFDLKYQIIPNKVLKKLLLISLIIKILYIVYLMFSANVDFIYEIKYELYQSILGVILFLASTLMSKLVVKNSLGWGDVKLLSIVGFILGIDASINMVIMMILLMFVVSVFLLLTKKAKKNNTIPLVPFVLFATLIVALFGYY